MRNLFNSFLTGRVNQIIPVSVIFLAVILGSIVFFIRYRVYVHRKKKFDLMSSLNDDGQILNESETKPEAPVEEVSENASDKAEVQAEAPVAESSLNASNEEETKAEAPVEEVFENESEKSETKVEAPVSETNEQDSKEKDVQNPEQDSQSTEIETNNTEDKVSEDEK